VIEKEGAGWYNRKRKQDVPGPAGGNMKLDRLTERIWVYPFEEERDRPNLSYIRGDRFSIAVDAGHSDAHVFDFYRALEREGLPFPSLTVITHWHWDHTMGMHAVRGLTLAGSRTNEHLLELQRSVAAGGGREAHLALHESIQKEYADGKPLIVTPADMVFPDEMKLDAGNCPVRLFHTLAPHTDDSVLICAESEKVLFLGDAPCGAFPTWEKKENLCRKLAETIASTDAQICLESHWTPLSRQQTIQDLLYPDA